MTLQRIVDSDRLRVRITKKDITHADLTDADTSQTVNFDSALPANVFVLGAFAEVTEEFVAPAIDATSATVTSTNAATYNMAPGDTLVIDTDNGGNETCTWDAASATVTDTTSYPCADQDGLTEVVTIDGGSPQTVTFSGATTTAVGVAAQLNTGLVGCSVDVVGGQVVISTDSKGTDSSVAIGTGTCALTWAAPVAGTGDVANIDAVTAEEVQTVIEADTTGLTVTIEDDDTVTLTSDTTGASSEIDVISGNAAAILGLTVETHVGTAAVAAGTATIDIGISSGDTDALVDGGNISAATGQIHIPKGVAPNGTYGGSTLSCIIATANQNCNAFSEGELTVYVPYINLTGYLL